MPVVKNNKHYVYAHIRNDTGTVFYIGKGTDTLNRKNFYRARTQYKKTDFWKNTVAKAGGYKVKIIAICQDEAHSFLLEKLLIKHFGRRNNHTGILVNLTDGGDGACGIIPSEATRKKLSISSSRKRSKAWVKAIRIARKNGGNGGVVKLGDKLPESWRKNIAVTKLGMLNPMWGRCGGSHPMARAVLDIDNLKEYSTIQMAADAFHLKMKTLYNMLSGHRKNKTTLRFKNET